MLNDRGTQGLGVNNMANVTQYAACCGRESNLPFTDRKFLTRLTAPPRHMDIRVMSVCLSVRPFNSSAGPATGLPNWRLLGMETMMHERQ